MTIKLPSSGRFWTFIGCTHKSLYSREHKIEWGRAQKKLRLSPAGGISSGFQDAGCPPCFGRADVRLARRENSGFGRAARPDGNHRQRQDGLKQPKPLPSFTKRRIFAGGLGGLRRLLHCREKYDRMKLWGSSPRFLFIAARAAFLIAVKKERARLLGGETGKESVWREGLPIYSAPWT